MIKDFEHFAPKTVKEACSLLAQYKDDAKIIAGGQSLLILMKQRLISPKYVIDIKGLSSLDYINFDKKEGLRIGALSTHRAVETSSVVRREFGVLAEMEQEVANLPIRNWGTIGGNLCQADPAGDPAPVLIALNARVKVASSTGERSVALEGFFKDYLETVLKPGEILTEIEVPNPAAHTGVAYARFSLVDQGHPLVGAAASITLDSRNATCKDARIVLGGSAATPMRAKKAEKVLIGKEIKDGLIEEAAQAASEEARPPSDIHASEEYRRKVAKVLVRRALKQALERVKKA